MSLTKKTNNSSVKEWAVAVIDLETKSTSLLSLKGKTKRWETSLKYTKEGAEKKVKDMTDSTDEQFIFYKCRKADMGGKKSWSF